MLPKNEMDVFPWEFEDGCLPNIIIMKRLIKKFKRLNLSMENYKNRVVLCSLLTNVDFELFPLRDVENLYNAFETGKKQDHIKKLIERVDVEDLVVKSRTLYFTPDLRHAYDFEDNDLFV